MCSAVENPGVKMSSAAPRRVDGVRVARRDETALDGLAGHARGVHPAPVVADVDHDAAPGLAGGDRQSPTRRLARGDALLRRLEAVVERVADEVDERVADRVDDRAIQLGLLADELEVDLLAQARREVADEPRQPQQHGLDRDHPDAHDELLERMRAAGQLRHRLPEPGHARPGDERLDVGAMDDELAHRVQEVVQAGGGDADGGCRRRLRLRGRCEDSVFGVDVSLGDTSTGRCDGSAIVGVRDIGNGGEGGEQRVRVVGPDPELDRGSGEAVERLGVGLGALQRAVLGRLAEHHERPDRRHLGVVGQADGDVQAAGGRVLAHERPQAGDERGRVQPLAVTGLDAVDGRVERVDAGQQHVDGVAVEAVAPLAEQLEDVLHRVRQLRDGVVAHRRAHALERVGDAEDLVDRGPVVGPLLDAHDREPEPLEVLARLGDEHREVLGDVHQPSRRYVCGRSGRRPSAAGSATRSVAPTSRTPPGRRVSASRACRSSRTPGVK